MQEKVVKVSDHLANSIGDHFRIWADEIDIKQLANVSTHNNQPYITELHTRSLYLFDI